MIAKSVFLSGPVNNEVDFIRVYDSDTKRKIEKVLMNNRISYCCQFEDKSLLQRLFRPGQDAACVFRIHDEEVPRAKELVRSVIGESNQNKKESK